MRYRKASFAALFLFVGLQFAALLFGLPLQTAAAQQLGLCGPDANNKPRRTIFYENMCAFPVWIGFTGGTVPCRTDGSLLCPTKKLTQCTPTGTAPAGTCSCQTNNDCAEGQTCAPATEDTNYCYWTQPALEGANGPVTSSMLAAANKETSTVLRSCLPERGSIVQLSGIIFGRTGCFQNNLGETVCDTATCSTDGNPKPSDFCQPGHGGNPPATLAEFTLQNSFAVPQAGNKDFYDITIINGSNVPMQMAPVTATFAADTTDPYSCQVPGSVVNSKTGLNKCSWNYNVSNPAQARLLRFIVPFHPNTPSGCPAGSTYLQVSNTCLCSSNSQCGAKLACGLGQGVLAGPDSPPGGLALACGTEAGEWSVDQICGVNPNFTMPGVLNCAQAFKYNNPNRPGTTTLTSLLQCPAGVESCYNNTTVATVDCCGCATWPQNPYYADWPKVLTNSAKNPKTTNGCYNNNVTWANNVQNWLAIMKQACPTAYTYPYDDVTSIFTCKSNGMSGGVAYRITYCPTSTLTRKVK